VSRRVLPMRVCPSATLRHVVCVCVRACMRVCRAAAPWMSLRRVGVPKVTDTVPSAKWTAQVPCMALPFYCPVYV
jgi:hypothetical protein